MGNVLDPELWRSLGERIHGRSLAYIGKQSHNFFGTRELYELLKLGTSTVVVGNSAESSIPNGNPVSPVNSVSSDEPSPSRNGVQWPAEA